MRTEVIVEQIHMDDFLNLYFTVRLSSNKDDDGKEILKGDTVRQTVAERLKHFPLPPIKPSSPTPILPPPLTSTGKSDHILHRLEKNILDRLIMRSMFP